MPGLRVLVTRPEPQSTATARLVEARGHRAFRCPLSRIEHVAAALPSVAEVDAVVLTSANAVPALRGFEALPVFAVGEATARAAERAGARTVRAAGGDWRSLGRLLTGPDGPPPGTRLLHLAGAAVRGDLAGEAVRAGFTFERRVVYAARPTARLDPRTHEMLVKGELDAILFFSPAHATIWRRLVERAALTDRMDRLRALALSPAVAENLATLPWRRLETVDAPEVARLLDRLEAPE